VIRVVVSWLANNTDVVQAVFHYLAGSGTSQDAADVLAAIVTSLAAEWSDHAASIITDNQEGTVAELLRWDPAQNQFDGLVQQAHTMDGTNTSNQLANGICMLLKFFTDVGRYQGRKYLGICTEAQLGDDGTFGATATTNGVLLAAGWDAPVTVGGMEFTTGVFNEAAERFTAFSQSVTAEDVPAYQRRRRPGTGE
jgi:hypothetical protein